MAGLEASGVLVTSPEDTCHVATLLFTQWSLHSAAGVPSETGKRIVADEAGVLHSVSKHPGNTDKYRQTCTLAECLMIQRDRILEMKKQHAGSKAPCATYRRNLVYPYVGTTSGCDTRI
jgi:hypothetical protein